MEAIGGYFGLELSLNKEYHQNAIRLNTGRNAFEYILRARGYKKVFLPYYTCEVMLEPLEKLGIQFEFYSLDKSFKPIFKFSELKEEDAIVYTNYFGICNSQVDEVVKFSKNIIIDNSQAFFSRPYTKMDTFYSPRKFFGVPDGAYLFTEEKLHLKFQKDLSYKRFENLLGRIDSGAENFYDEFLRNDTLLSGQPIRNMSNLTQRLLRSIDYDEVKTRRLENYSILCDAFNKMNLLDFRDNDVDVPMVYPLLIPSGSKLKSHLISSKIYVATYWPNIYKRIPENSWERNLVENLICLPIDQRYGFEEMNYIKTIMKEYTF